jgi:putative ABC transport system substrate-binding protein
MWRREFLTLLGGTAAAWPLVARAQQPAMPVVGILGSESSDLFEVRLRAFRQGLSEAGYAEGRNVAIEYGSADGKNDRLPALAADMVRRKVAVIATMGGAQSAFAAKAATTTIPIVFYTGGDPVQNGLVASLNRPGGNLTGVTGLTSEVGPKRLELAHELVPTATDIALLINPSIPPPAEASRDMQAAARILGVNLRVLNASTERDINTAFASLAQLRAGALVISSNAFFTTRNEQIAALGLRHAVPVIYQFREFATAGGLISYGSSVSELHRTTGALTGRLLKGEKPADLPVQQATRIELIINLKTAKALGLAMPTALLVRADEVIE